MRTKMIMITVLSLSVLGAGAASAASGCTDCNCGDEKAVKQLTNETAPISSRLEAKKLELRQAYGNDSIDINKVNEVEAEIRILKGQIRGVADKLNIRECKLG